MEKYRVYGRRLAKTVTIREPAIQTESKAKSPGEKKSEQPRSTELQDKPTATSTEKKESETVPAPVPIPVAVSASSAVATPGKYTNWTSKHAELAAQPWCCIGDLMNFCDKYEYKTISTNDEKTHRQIVVEVKCMLNGAAPFDVRTRFPSDIQSPENLWVCVGRCPGVEYHLNRILSAFRKPLAKLSPDKQRMARQNFHLAVNELHLDISARILDIRLYDRAVFERDFRLQWEDAAV